MDWKIKYLDLDLGKLINRCYVIPMRNTARVFIEIAKMTLTCI